MLPLTVRADDADALRDALRESVTLHGTAYLVRAPGLVTVLDPANVEVVRPDEAPCPFCAPDELCAIHVAEIDDRTDGAYSRLVARAKDTRTFDEWLADHGFAREPS